MEGSEAVQGCVAVMGSLFYGTSKRNFKNCAIRKGAIKKMKDFEIRCDESRLETNHTLYGKFTLGPFLPGQGTTFGNALRRSLLSELSGLAITAFEILGVMQEFSTLPGLRESVLDLSLNLKQVALTGLLPYSTPPIGFLKVRGPAVIKAADLKFPAGVYCTSPNQYIATLSSNGVLNLKFLVSVGKGYSTQPYSFYRSLSKVKLQSTFATTPGMENNSIEKDYLGFPKDFFEQRKSEQAIPPVRGIISNSSSENISQKEFHATPKGIASWEGKAGSRTSPLPPLPLREPKGIMGSQPYTATQTCTASRTEGGNGGTGVTEDTLKNEINNSLSGGLAKESTRSSNFSQFRKTEPSLPNKASGKFLQSKNSEFLNSSGLRNTFGAYMPKPFEEARNASISPLPPVPLREPKGVMGSGGEAVQGYRQERSSSCSGYVDIQTQIFQRVTPHQVLPIDAVFTPVSQVNFLTQVNDRFEIARENIVLEIWTNGSIHPKRALEEATLSLVQNFDTLLKKIQQGSSFYKGLRYWSYLQSLDYVNKPPITARQPSALPPTPKGSVVQQALITPEGLPSSTGLPSSNGGTGVLADTVTSEMFAVGKKGPKVGMRDPSRKHLHQAIYNLDIGNLNLSLETFILLKQAKINTLSQLLTYFSPQDNKITINPKPSKSSGVENNLFLNEKIVNELNNLINQFD